MIEVSIYLFGKPGWEMKLEGIRELNTDVLRIKGDELKERLECVAEMADVLQSKGWSLWGSYGDMYGLDFFNEKIETIMEAEKALLSYGIDPDVVDIHELIE